MATVLLADDHPVTLAYTRNKLILARFDVTTATNAFQALRIAKTHAPPDVIVSDIRMPEGDGYMLCREVRADPRLAHIPVILYSQYEITPPIVARARAAGATVMLTWDLDVGPLIQRIRDLLEPPPPAA